MRRGLPAVGLLLAAPVACPLQAQDGTRTLAVRTTLSAETLRLPGRESLGLAGITSTADLGPAYLGPGL
ncbi:MAG TPA: hypothetical protein VFT46_04780, partial [Holophagaceae bacterium]|nr:hypothetical protein [Holophagaceae bacterium]